MAHSQHIPCVTPPPHVVDRRAAPRRASDRALQTETNLLAHSLDALAADRPAEERLASLLDVIASSVGAARCAVLAEGSRGGDRRIVVIAAASERGAAEAFAAWLDAGSPRPRAMRATQPPAEVALIGAHGRSPARRFPARPHQRLVSVPGGHSTLGLVFSSRARAEAGMAAMTPAMARHAAAALATATRHYFDERDLAELRARDAQRDRFVSTVVHELRTPLTSLGGYLDLIDEGRVADPADRREFLGRSRDLVGTLSSLVSDLLEMSRLDSGRLDMEPGPFSAAEAGQTVLDRLMPIALQRGTRLAASLGSRLRTVFADRRRVEQILLNLAGNAVKFTPDGGRVEVQLAFDGPAAIFTVRDDGPGLEHEDRARIFERFYRTAGVTRITGSGLGLTIARELARAMGGDLDVASELGRGSTFVLALPARPGVEPELVRQALQRALAAEGLRLAQTPEVAAAPATPELVLAPARPAPSLLPAGRALAGLRLRRLRPVDGVLALAD
ncbi:MAG TPA: HAMP domain-containing sensor histidine kinase [Candidatus Limnocylindrales bacterium]|nr:HAMP domain-containing sensor histidine kinase [Candidatus Limnocylindrales bacterium]